MKRFFRKIMSAVVAASIILSVGAAVPPLSASAKESVGNGLILSEDSIAIAEGASATFTAVLAGDADASRLAVVVADPGEKRLIKIEKKGKLQIKSILFSLPFVPGRQVLHPAFQYG